MKMKPEADHQESNIKEFREKVKKEDNESSALDFTSLISNEVIGISDIPIFRVNKVEVGSVEPKPVGSAYILINMSATEAPKLRVNA